MRAVLAAFLAFPASALAGGITLEVSDLVIGERVTFTVSGLAPGEEARLVRGSAAGAGPCIGALGGACLGITPAVLFADVEGDGAGIGVLEVTLPPSLAPGRSLAFQAVVADGAASRLSEPVVGEAMEPGVDPEAPGDMVAPERVFGAANTDDDDENGVQDVFDGDDPIDRATFAVLADPAAPERGVASYEITMSGDMGATVFLDGELLLHGLTGPFTDEVSWSADPLDLAVDFAGFNTETLLTVSELSAAGRVLDSRVIRLVSAPLLLNHHLQPAEQLFTVRTRGGFFIGDNVEFVTPMTDALGDLMWEVEGSTVGQDVWIQDEVEFATSNFDDRTHDIVVDSIRDRGLDTWPEAAFYGPDWAVHTWGSGFGNTYDSFGNLEASPPVTVGDTTYPFGRIYYGAEGGASPNAALTNFLAAQEVQAPFELDTSWLCVGHVDEFMSFVPDATSPKGFRMVWTDIPGAWELIDAMDPGIMMPRMRDHGHGTVESFQTDSHLRDYNADLDAVFLEPMKAQIMAELGLVESDIIYVPGLFEEACGRLAAAMVPGMANLVVSNPEGGPSHILTADPFFRTDTFDRSADPFVAAFEAAMPAEHEVVWVDDWEDYHLLLGEVHCGTNVVRTQTLDWWTDADALERMGE